MTARKLAIDALVRVDEGGAYANLVVPAMLERSDLDRRDRAFVTALVYGTVRMRRACDWLVDRFLVRDVDATVRAALQVGAYQLAFLDSPPHAAVGETVAAVTGRARGLVNAVLRRVADSLPVEWPDDATRLSYPDWLFQRLVADLGRPDALAAMEAMNQPADVTERPDAYVQDLASQWVAAAVDAQPGERVADVCAAPGGKATGLAAAGAWVAASDVHLARTGLIVANAERLGSDGLRVLVADGRCAPYREGSFDRVLVDAPCTGLGALRRRPDARWRVQEADAARLVRLQRELLSSATTLVRPGGTLVYSVCTLTAAESLDVDASLGASLEPLPPPDPPWEPYGRGARLLPQTAGTDGMILFRYRRRP